MTVIIRKICEKRRLSTSTSNTLNIKLFIGIFSISIVLGLTWIFGAFIFDDVVRYLFVIFNSSQGFLFFIFIVVIGTEGRAFWTNTLRINKVIKRPLNNAYTLKTSNGTSTQHNKSSTNTHLDDVVDKETMVELNTRDDADSLKKYKWCDEDVGFNNEHFDLSTNSNGETELANGEKSVCTTTSLSDDVAVQIDTENK